MGALLVVVFCVAAGIVTARLPHPPGLAQAFNWWVVYIALPALVLGQITLLDSSAPLLLPAVSIWLVFLGGWLFIALAGYLLGWPRDKIGALVLTAGLGNTSFVGYPLIEALRGEAALGMAVIADQFGSFLMLSTLGLVVAALYSGQRVKVLGILRRVLIFPAFWALLIALGLRAAGEAPPLILELSQRLGVTLTPLALFSIGLQLRLRSAGSDSTPLLLGLSWKLLLAPLVVSLFLWANAATGTSSAAIIILQAAMAPMVTGGIIAQQYGLAPALASRMVGIGLIISLVTVPLLSYAMA
jgi:predicted permease